jgi:hypothetical protein
VVRAAGLLLLATGLAAAAPGRVPPDHPPGWMSWTLDASAAAESNALAFDGLGRWRAAYLHGAPVYALRVAVPVAEGTGNCGLRGSARCETVDAATGALDLALTAAGEPHVSYTAGGLLRYARAVGSGGNCGPALSWGCATIDGGGPLDAGRGNALALAPGTGAARISYYEATGRDLRFAAAGAPGGNCGPGGSWRCEVIDAAGDAGWETALALDAGGQAVIAYYDCGSQPGPPCDRGDLKVARQVAAGTGNCGPELAWRCEVIDAAGDTGWQPSLALDGAGRAHVAYFACGSAADCSDDGSLRYAAEVESGGNCGPGLAWRCETVDGDGPAVVGLFPALRLDASGVAHISYYDASAQQLRFAYRAGGTATCGEAGGWQCAVVAPARSGETALALNAGGLPLVLYRSAQGARLAQMGWVMLAPVMVRR